MCAALPPIIWCIDCCRCCCWCWYYIDAPKEKTAEDIGTTLRRDLMYLTRVSEAAWRLKGICVTFLLLIAKPRRIHKTLTSHEILKWHFIHWTKTIFHHRNDVIQPCSAVCCPCLVLFVLMHCSFYFGHAVHAQAGILEALIKQVLHAGLYATLVSKLACSDVHFLCVCFVLLFYFIPVLALRRGG
jgi:hypothetical protein